MSDALNDATKSAQQYDAAVTKLREVLEYLKQPSEEKLNVILGQLDNRENIYFFFAPFQNGSRSSWAKGEIRQKIAADFLQSLTFRDPQNWTRLITDLQECLSADDYSLTRDFQDISPFKDDILIAAEYWGGEIKIKDTSGAIEKIMIRHEYTLKNCDKFLIFIPGDTKLDAIKVKKTEKQITPP